MLSNSQSERGKQFRGISPQGAIRGNALLGHGAAIAGAPVYGTAQLVVQNGRVLKSGYEEGYFRQPTVS
jgi:hypothetical protein